MPLRHGMLVFALLSAGVCLAQTGDAERETRRQAEEAAKRAMDAEAARRRADEESARGQPRLQHPIDRYSPPSASGMFEQAAVLEQQGKGSEAVKLYMHAVRAGSGKAALRLGEIYDKGIPGVARDYAESLKWYHAARVLGEEAPLRKTP